MKKVLTTLVTAFMALYWNCNAQTVDLIDLLPERAQSKDGDYSINIDGIDFIVSFNNKAITKTRALLFDDFVRKSIDSKVLDYVEEAYADHILYTADPRFENISFTMGSWLDLAMYRNDADISVMNNAFREYRIIWKKGNNSTIMTFPLSYDKLNGGSRAEIENRYITRLKKFKVKTLRGIPAFTEDELKQVGNGIYILPGKTYLIDNVNRNVYVSLSGTVPELVNSEDEPVYTLTNMIIAGIANNINVELKILKHIYGESETITVPLEALIQYNLANGCEVYWGFDKIEGNTVKGSIFFYNENEGYDHIVRMEMERNLLHQTCVAKGTASLFIPSNNVKNLL